MSISHINIIPSCLTSIKTRDGVRLDGIVVEPKRKKSDTALIWLHGLSSTFYSGSALIKELSSQCSRAGIGYFKFNTRGHDIVARSNDRLIGAGFEEFEDCIYDIRAMILYARKLGYRKIILAGHSTGANKALYYLYKTRDRSVKGIILLGPINDIIAEQQRNGAAYVMRGIKTARRLAKAKKSDALMPIEFGVLTARRFLSLYESGLAEDTFPYYNPQARWKELRSVRVPIAVILGSRDEYLDRPANELINIFKIHATSARSFSSMIIKGANHSFQKKERELAGSLIDWIKKCDNKL